MTSDRYGKDDPRFPPRTVTLGPPAGEDYFTLTALHGRPRGRFEQIKPPARSHRFGALGGALAREPEAVQDLPARTAALDQQA